jgi:uroporphyrinogen-III synthase
MSTAAAKGRPLARWRILVTRAGLQAKSLSAPLRQKGAEVIEVPTIEIHPPASYDSLDHALREMEGYNILILTSVNGVAALFERWRKLRLPKSQLSHLLVVAIGPATADALRGEGLVVSVVPERYIAESVVEALRGSVTNESRVLLVRAKVARDVLPTELRNLGAHVDVVEAYETRVPQSAAQKLQEIFSSSATKPHFVTFTSSSTAANFLDLLGAGARESLRDVCLASIGPVTSATLRNAGFPPTIEAKQYTMGGLVEAIADYAMSRLDGWSRPSGLR